MSQVQTPQNASATPQSQSQIDATEAARLLDIVINRTPTAAGKAISDQLDRNIEKLRELLPDYMKDQATRLVKRAIMYFDRKPELADCTLASKIKAILEAAEMGLAIDGILCYAVPYNNKYKIKGPDGRERDEWRKEVQCQPSYKGLTVVARRTKQIADIYGDVVCKGDHFKHGRFNDQNICEHTYDHEGERGEVTAAYMVVKFHDGSWRYEVMQLKELERIRACSKMRSGPAWTQHPGEMYKKTVLRRALKLYCDDPGVLMAVELDEKEFTEDPNSNAITRGPANVRIDPLNDTLKPKTQAAPGPDPSQEPQGTGTANDNGNCTGLPDPEPAGSSPEPAQTTQEAPQDAAGDPQGRHSLGDDVRLSPLAVEFYDRLSDKGLTRDANVVIWGEIMAVRKSLEEGDLEYLERKYNENIAGFTGKKRPR